MLATFWHLTPTPVGERNKEPALEPLGATVGTDGSVRLLQEFSPVERKSGELDIRFGETKTEQHCRGLCRSNERKQCSLELLSPNLREAWVESSSRRPSWPCKPQAGQADCPKERLRLPVKQTASCALATSRLAAGVSFSFEDMDFGNACARRTGIPINEDHLQAVEEIFAPVQRCFSQIPSSDVQRLL